MKWFESFCWFWTALMAAVATARMVFLAIQPNVSAPQYAAESAGIVAMTVVPYVFARAVQGMRQTKVQPPSRDAREWSDTKPF